MTHDTRNRLGQEVFRTVSMRGSELCNVVAGNTITSSTFQRKLSIVCRTYATLVVITVVDESKTRLSMLHIIHTILQIVNGCFEDVSEVQLRFNAD
jgi:AP-3 complex subunit sigma